MNFLPPQKPLVQKLNRFYSSNSDAVKVSSLIFLGVLSLGLLQSQVSVPNPSPVTLSAANASIMENDIARAIYGQKVDLNNPEMAGMFARQVKLITTRPAFVPALGVVKKHEDAIRAQARAKGVPENVAIGVAFLENGGSETAVSYAGAAGIFQLMPGTARGLGLTVNSYRDDRMDTTKNIEAGVRYLANNYKLFNDWGLTVWSYHAGAGNVSKAINIYLQANHNVSFPKILQSSQWPAIIDKYDITLHKLMTDSTVKQQLTDRLADDTAGYAYKVIATSYLFELSNQIEDQELMHRVALLKQDNIDIKDFFNS